MFLVVQRGCTKVGSPWFGILPTTHGLLLPLLGTTSGMDTQTETLQLAQKILGLARQTLLVKLPYLSALLAQLNFEFVEDLPQNTAPKHSVFSSSNAGLSINAPLLVSQFVRAGEPPVHDLLHQLLHLVLGHYQVGPQVSAAKWNVAADACVEFLTQALLGPRAGERGAAQQAAFAQLKGTLGHMDQRLSAERLYQALEDARLPIDAVQLQKLCFVDDHHAWYPQNEGTSDQAQTADKNNGSQSSEANDPTSTDTPNGPEVPPASAIATREVPDWKKLAAELMAELELQGQQASSKYAALVQELATTQHKTRSYEDFLRSFVQVSEEPYLSDDEFDYLSYTLGLTLYGNMPLIEPLEYRTRAAIRDFVIVLDTSSSVAGAIVQEFVNTTYDILAASGAFFDRFNLHLIQCDTRVRQDTKITNLQELERWASHVKLFGFGGTDFRPAFAYINELVAAHEFEDLAGVIYLTDGWGIYPELMPPYKVAFVFYDEDHRPDLVPAWAEQLTINAGQFSSLSVYDRKRPATHPSHPDAPQ